LIAVRNWERRLTLRLFWLMFCLARFLACALLAIKIPRQLKL
jgi:hypothetical protein